MSQGDQETAVSLSYHQNRPAGAVFEQLSLLLSHVLEVLTAQWTLMGHLRCLSEGFYHWPKEIAETFRAGLVKVYVNGCEIKRTLLCWVLASSPFAFHLIFIKRHGTVFSGHCFRGVVQKC